jgi:hypothetical protein
LVLTLDGQLSIKAATVAMIGFTKSNAVLIAATAAAVLLLHAYETNFWGLKDAINGAMGVEKEHITTLEEERAALDANTDSTSNLLKEVGKVPDTYDKAAKALAKYRADLLGIAADQKLATEANQRFNSTIQIPTSLSGFSAGVDSPVKQKKGGLFGILEKLSQLQLVGNQAFAEPYIPKTENQVFQQFDIIPDIEFGGAGGLNFVSGLSVTNKEGKKINVNDLAFEFLHKEALVESTEFRRRSFAAIELEKIQQNRVTEIAKFGVSSMIGTELLLKGDRSGFDPARGDFLIPDEPDTVEEDIETIINPSANDFKFGIDIATREGINPKSTRGKVLNKTGRDIGSIGRFIDVNEGIRLANLQTTMAGFSNTKGGKSSLLAEALALGGSAHGGLSKGTTDMLSGFGAVARNKAYNIALGNGQLSATAAYQVPKGSIRASDDFYARNRMKDSNTNRLNLMGGTRVEGIPMDEAGAVVGGYSSRREYRRVQ